MKKEKQLQLLECIASGRYRVYDGVIQSFKKVIGAWRKLNPHRMSGNHKQMAIFNGKRGKKGICVDVYATVFAYIFYNGQYEEGMIIKCLDGNTDNLAKENLRAVPRRVDVDALNPLLGRITTPEGTRHIRGTEIHQIRELSALGYSYSAIARHLDLNRLSVRGCCISLKSGKILKYESWFKEGDPLYKKYDPPVVGTPEAGTDTIV